MSKIRHRQIRTLSYEYPSGHSIRSHAHVEHQRVYASTGVMTVHTPQGSWVVPTHRAVWVPGKTEHSIQIAGRVAMRTLYLIPGLSRSLPVGCQVLSVSPLLREIILCAVEVG